MPKRLRQYAPKKSVKRSRRSSKPVGLYKSLRSINDSDVYTFRRTCNPMNVLLNTLVGFQVVGSAETVSFTFSLSGVQMWLGTQQSTTTPLPGNSEFQSLFKEYRIKRIKMQCFWSSAAPAQALNGSDPANSFMYKFANPTFITANDTDVYAGLSDLDNLLQNQKAVALSATPGNPAGGIVRYCYPKYRQSVYTGASAAWSAGGGWLDTGNLDVPYAGFQVGYPAGSNGSFDGTAGSLQFIFTYDIECKQVK